MPETLQIILITVGMIVIGAGLSLSALLLGAWLMFKAKATPGSGEGFLKDPKGEIFTIPDESPPFPGSEEPSADERNVLRKTESFLKALGVQDGS